MTTKVCPTPTKIAYASRTAAAAAKSRHGRRMRTYLCDGCGKYHLASWTKDEFGE